MPHDAMLYIFDAVDEIRDSFVENAMPLLSSQRRERVLSYRFLRDRKLSLASYLLLRLALEEGYGITQPVWFGFGKNEKPFLRDYPHIHFSLSHCRGTAACAVSAVEIGVDVQEIAPVQDALARRVLTADEYEAFRTSPSPEELFCECWVKKESFLKKTAQGIAEDLTTLAVRDMTEFTLLRGRDYYCCVNGASVKLRRVSVKDLGTWTKL